MHKVFIESNNFGHFNMATYAIGDIHGCFTALESLLQVVQPKSDDTIVFLGDYVDRGPNSAHVLEFLLHYDQAEKVLLLGNHEIMMMEFRKQTPETSRWLEYGGAETLASYGLEYSPSWHEVIPAAHWDFIEGAQAYYQENDFLFVHAGVQPGVSMEKQTPQSLFWDKMIDPQPYAQNVKVICGHTAQKNGQVANFGHTICIDTCAYGGQWLTCLETAWGRYWQANQKGEIREGQLFYQ